MNEIMAIEGVLGLSVLAAVFVIVYLVTYRALEEMDVSGGSQKTLAAIVALLSVLGLTRFTPAPAPKEPVALDPTLEFLLIPYAALAVVLVVLFLVVFLGRWLGFGKPLGQGRAERPERYPHRATGDERGAQRDWAQPARREEPEKRLHLPTQEPGCKGRGQR